MKNISLIFVLLFYMIAPLQAIDSSDIALELSRVKKMDKVIQRTNQIYEYADSYILQSADPMTLTMANLKAKFSLSDKSFEGYNQKFNITYDASKATIVFSNAAPRNMTDRMKKIIKNSTTLHSRGYFDESSKKFIYRVSSVVKQYLNNLSSIDTTIAMVSENEPTDITKYWYKPNGQGSFEVYTYKNGAWSLDIKDMFSTSRDNSLKVLSSKDELENLKLPIGSIVYVQNGENAESYVMGKDSWAKAVTTSSNTLSTASDCTVKTLGSIKISKEEGCTQFCANNEGSPQWQCFGKQTEKKYNSCYAIKQAEPNSQDGLYSIDPDGEGGSEAFQVYCDMTTDGGGWTLVWSNLRNSTDKYETDMNWVKATTTQPLVKGNLEDTLDKFQVYTGLIYWNKLGSKIRYTWANEGVAIDQSFIADFVLEGTNNYTIRMNNYQRVKGFLNAGLYTSHNNQAFSTIDKDNDNNSGSCAGYYSNTPFWYKCCWSGSINGGGESSGGGYKNGAYWSFSDRVWGLDSGSGAGNGWIWIGGIQQANEPFYIEKVNKVIKEQRIGTIKTRTKSRIGTTKYHTKNRIITSRTETRAARYYYSGWGNTRTVGCDSGFTLKTTYNRTPTYSCTKTTNEYTCPSGYNMSGTSCTQNYTEFSCPSGYNMSGTSCTQNYTEFSCKSGYTMDGTDCKKTIQVCPDNTVEKDNKCLVER